MQNKGNYPNALPIGTILNGQYCIEDILGQGGFGITYLGIDLNLELKVAIKEYYPEGVATRNYETRQVAVYVGEMGEVFEYGTKHFLDEAKMLAKFQTNPQIVGVKNFFKENNTAYIVMDYIEGISFKDYLIQMGGSILVEDAIGLLVPIMNALSEVHQAGLLHRDISPDNIYITSQGSSKLLDFGAARYSLGEKSKSLSVILKPGYAPEEQYRSKGKQGPWTDVYALAATFYHCITGILPPEALDRLEVDELKRPSELGVTIPQYIEEALIKALAVKAKDRYQTVKAFQEALCQNEAEKVVIAPLKEIEGKSEQDEKPIETVPHQEVKSSRTKKWIALGTSIAGVLTIGGAFVLGNKLEYHTPIQVETIQAVEELTSNTDAVENNELDEDIEENNVEGNSNINTSNVSSGVNGFKRVADMADNSMDVNNEELGIDYDDGNDTLWNWDYINVGNWDYIGSFSEGYVIARRGSFADGEWYFINEQGEIVCSAYNFGYQFACGLAEVRIGDEANGKWGFIDPSGNMVISPIWDDAYGFYNGYAQVCDKSRGREEWYFINAYGQILFNEGFAKAQSFQHGLAAVKCYNINPNKWGFINEQNQLQIDCIYDDTYGFGEYDLAPVQVNGMWGMINKSGQFVLSPIWEELRPFSQGLAAAKDPNTGKWGFINQNGVFAISPQWDAVISFIGGVTAVRVGDEATGKWGFIDQTGSMVITPRWDKASRVDEDKATVLENGQYRVIQFYQ